VLPGTAATAVARLVAVEPGVFALTGCHAVDVDSGGRDFALPSLGHLVVKSALPEDPTTHGSEDPIAAPLPAAKPAAPPVKEGPVTAPWTAGCGPWDLSELSAEDRQRIFGDPVDLDGDDEETAPPGSAAAPEDSSAAPASHTGDPLLGKTATEPPPVQQQPPRVTPAGLPVYDPAGPLPGPPPGPPPPLEDTDPPEGV